MTIPPIACDMTDAEDTPTERVAEYGRLFRESLVGRERTESGVRFRFRTDPGVADRVRDLARREGACCAFFGFAVAVHDDELWWDATVVDDAVARQILDEFFWLPDTVTEGVEGVGDRFARRGLAMMARSPHRPQAAGEEFTPR